jgi:RNA polymerase sigma-70 factor (ECF subfamily)
MARPVFRRSGAAGGAAPRIVHLDLDRPLVDAALRDPERFEALYRRYVAPVYSFAYYELGDHHAAEDATARTFLSALANLGRFEERARPEDGEGASTFKVWLFRIARNVIANERRSARRHPAAVLDEATTAIVADPLDIEGDSVRRDEAATAWHSVGRLPGDRRRALVLRFVDELSTAEIAGVMGRSEGAVRVLIHRALRSVARDLGAGPGSGAGPRGGRRQGRAR